MAPIGRTSDANDESGERTGSTETDDEPPSDERADADDSTIEAETDDQRPSHLREVDDGSGCVELWERLSEKRE